MSPETQIPIASRAAGQRFASRLALFYGAIFALSGAHLPFFSVWLKAVGIDAFWIGIINAVPAVTRFTTLPFVTGLAERRHALRGAMILTAFASALGFVLLGMQHQLLPLLLIYTATCILWSPTVPLTDAYALRGVVRYGLNYGPLRLWGSAAFVVGALACGMLADIISARELIWVIVAVAALAAAVSLLLQPSDDMRRKSVATGGDDGLLRDPAFLTIIVSAALIQGSHAAYYTFASITWQAHGLGGLTIAGLWALGVVAEILVFAVSPRFTLDPWVLVVIGGLSAVARWSITAQDPQVAVLVVAQLGHGLTFGLTQVGTMGQLVRHVPVHSMARGQGYYAAAGGLLTSVTYVSSDAIYTRYGEGVYYLMAAMAGTGALLMWLARHRLQLQPQSGASGG